MADDDEEPNRGNVTNSEMKQSSSLQKMLDSITKERSKPSFSISGDFELISNEKVTDLKNKSFLKPEIEVYRKDSKLKPSLQDESVDWEETVYLNIILHQKFSQRVYPSPSKRQMDSKGTHEEIAYPNIYFTVDNFDDAFTDIIVRDSEMVCVELKAADRTGVFQGVIFLGSIRYESLKKVYDARASLTSKMVQSMSLGWLTKSHKRVEFVRMRGPHSKGHAEMAVSRVKGSGPETPDIENFPVNDFEDLDNQQEENQYTQRRMSDPNASFGSLVRGGIKRLSMKKSRSEAERINDDMTDGFHEVEASSVHDEIENGEESVGFIGRTFGQAWHLFKERKRANSVALNAYLTYVTLPWYRIIADVLDVRQQPVLVF
ncbi:Uncharacterized protein KIAA0930 homolog,Uncharacterized protein KIAA0930 [Mytilus coruscus]|uniref:Uncharacterized protein KIAA0930 homolog,Uncharacterized protein KIAA0930 n=1 Tax=Mytilus coruscus TaxID=42192 RepID=A0A6J8BQG9_MYTCO|nr:Uncharacterized protein KIAA0930 homolog,Uncharacterized protein KIAA0930 [Mytilus coruscus]